MGSWLLVVGVATMSLATWPVLPIRGAQLSDIVAGVGALLILLTARRMPPRAAIAAGIAYAAFATLSTLLAHGSLLRLCGYIWLVVLAYAAYCEPRHLRRAIVVAALVAAIAGLVGAALYYAGTPTGLLNIAGDLVPGNYPRIRGTMVRANALAGLVATALLLLDEIPRRWRMPAAVVLLAALLFTFSRTWLSLAAVVAITRLPRRFALVVLLVAIAALVAISWLNFRLDPTHPWNVSIEPGPGTRFVHLRDALSTVAAHPLGVGAGGTATANGWDAHFTLVNIAAVIGIPAAIAFAALVITALRAASGPIRAALILFCLDALARDVEDQRVLWVLIGLALAQRLRA